MGWCARSRRGTSSRTRSTRSAITGEIASPNDRLSSDSGGTSALLTAMRLHARGVPVVSVMTMGKLRPRWMSLKRTRNCGLLVDGSVACAATRASSSDVPDPTCLSRCTACWVNWNSATTSTLPIGNSAVLSSVLPRVVVGPVGRFMPCTSSAARAEGPRGRTRASTAPLQHLEPAQVRPQRRRDHHRAVRLLVVLEQRRERARQRHARCIQRVRVLDARAHLAPVAHPHASCLEVLEVRARAALEPCLLAGRPYFEVVALGRGEAH